MRERGFYWVFSKVLGFYWVYSRGFFGCFKRIKHCFSWFMMCFLNVLFGICVCSSWLGYVSVLPIFAGWFLLQQKAAQNKGLSFMAWCSLL